ncbi:MAG: LptF/LptG family permease, partial [Kamptonema sp. SIO4C4]|nr:LptF/LptG family permease [Kamptonema sp. SIO4C4]
MLERRCLWEEQGGPLQVAELQWRISAPISVIVLTLMAVPLSHTSPRQGRFLHLFTAVLIYF